MNSCLISCRVRHERFAPKQHSFAYPLYTYMIDIDELLKLDHKLSLFGYNNLRLASFYDKDYLEQGAEGIRTKLTSLLAKQNVELLPDDTVYLVTSARFLNYAFNPVCFYWMFREENLLGCMAEVNNTFGEKHVYPLIGADIPQDIADATQLERLGVNNSTFFPAEYRSPKKFHVSPFMDLTGEYHFSFEDIRKQLDVTVGLFHGDQKFFEANLTEEHRVPLSDKALLNTALTRPFTAHITLPRILWEARKIHFGKGIRYYPKQAPISTMTIRHNTRPKLKDRLAQKLVLNFLKRMQHGQLILTMPDGTTENFGEQRSDTSADVTIHSDNFFSMSAFNGNIGLGEGYAQGLWDSSDLVKVIRFFLENRQVHARTRNLLTNTQARVLGAIQRYRHQKAPKNNEIGSKENITAHYDLSNELFRQFLDPTMTYSSAVFLDPYDVTEDLEAAQLRKNRLLADKANIGADDHVLEMGCGWGGFAEQTARERGCRITGVTLSHDQYSYATKRIKDAQLEHLVDIRLEDYRNISEQYDKIVSIEMLEAVGHNFHKEYFCKINELLKPSGVAVIQTITIQDAQYNHYRWSMDWIRKHIFPGGELPSLARICEVTSDSTSLSVQQVDAIGLHYANTLNQWRQQFNASWKSIEPLGFDDYFLRTWNYYLAICEAGFLQGHINDLLIVLSRASSE